MKFPALKRTQAPITPEILEAQAALLRAQAASKVNAPVAPPPEKVIKPTPIPKKVDMGPYEKVIVFDAGPKEGEGVIWITLLPRRLLMEHLDIEARRLKQPMRFCRLLGILIGVGISMPVGGVVGLIMVIGGILTSPVFGILLCILLGAFLGFIPGWYIGPGLFTTYPMWFVRKNGEVVTPIQHKAFSKERFTGTMKWVKEDDGAMRCEVPPGVMAQSAVFLFHAIRSKDLIDMWRSVSGRMQKITMTAMIVIAVCSLIIMFLVGYTTLSGPKGEETSQQTPSAKVVPGGSYAK